MCVWLRACFVWHMEYFGVAPICGVLWRNTPGVHPQPQPFVPEIVTKPVNPKKWRRKTRKLGVFCHPSPDFMFLKGSRTRQKPPKRDFFQMSNEHNLPSQLGLFLQNLLVDVSAFSTWSDPSAVAPKGWFHKCFCPLPDQRLRRRIGGWLLMLMLMLPYLKTWWMRAAYKVGCDFNMWESWQHSLVHWAWEIQRRAAYLHGCGPILTIPKMVRWTVM